MYYNLVRIHASLRVTLAIAAGVTDKVWEIADIVALIEANEAERPMVRGAYRKKLNLMQLRTFSDAQIKEFMRLHLTKYPDAVERMHFVMKHPFRDNHDEIYRNRREMRDTAKQLAFFHAHAKAIPKERLVHGTDGYYHANYDISADVIAYVANMLGPIGSYEIEE